MKVKLISRHEQDYTHETRSAPIPVYHNLDPAEHPFDKALEYTRALTAAKLDRLFAKPFIGSLNAHVDTVTHIVRDPLAYQYALSASADGGLCLWDLQAKSLFRAHSDAFPGFVKGVAYTRNAHNIVACSQDRINIYDRQLTLKHSLSVDSTHASRGLLASSSSSSSAFANRKTEDNDDSYQYVDLDASPMLDDTYCVATSMGMIHIRNVHAHAPVSQFSSGTDYSVLSCRFNRAEHAVIACTTSNRSVDLFDMRAQSRVASVVLAQQANCLSWNPQNPLSFVVANEDTNLYLFDMRRLSSAMRKFAGHVGPVLSCDFSTTGREIVSGSYDRTVRIWKEGEGASREVYHTSRMQRVFSVCWSSDSKMVLTGSEDTCVRMWRAQASVAPKTMLPKEKDASNYRRTLVKRYEHMPEIKRIVKHRHVPKAVLGAERLRKIVIESRKRKEENRRRHREVRGARVAERKKMVLKTDDGSSAQQQQDDDDDES